MSKLFHIVFVVFLVTTLTACPPIDSQDPDIGSKEPEMDSFDIPSIPSNELLFELPDNAFVVSESFTFTTLEEETYQYEGLFEIMNVTTSYVIQNDGEDEVMDLLLPFFPVESRSIDDITDTFTVKVNNEVLQLDWHFSQGNKFPENYENYSYEGVKNLLADPTSYFLDKMIYTYEFTLPLKGENQSLSISIPDGTKILQDYYSEHEDAVHSRLTDLFVYTGGEMVVAPTEILTTGRFYTIGQPATLTSNYDENGGGWGHTLSQFSKNRCYSEICEEQYKSAFYDFIMSDTLSTNMYDLAIQTHPSAETLLAFTESIVLKGYGEQTIIEVSFQITGGFHYENEGQRNEEFRSIFYDFYFDTQRYIGSDITVDIVIQSPYIIYESNYDFTENNEIKYQPNNGNHIYFELIIDQEE